MSNAVIVFVRFPEKGKVKTRLAKTLGEEFAVNFYKVCAEHTFSECRKISQHQTDIYICCADENDIEIIKSWTGNDFKYFAQKGEDIGIKMLNAFRYVFTHNVKNAVLIGTDIPEISSGIISGALNSLENSDVVIGPARDGGYYLIGMNKIYESVFREITWESKNVYSETLGRLNESNIKLVIAPLLNDIDTEENLIEWMGSEQSDEINEVRDFVRQYFNLLK